MPFEQARTLLCQGEALRRARRPAASRAPLQHALTIFSGLEARPWAARATTELAAAGGQARPRGDASACGLSSLSPQELQVARAVGRGLNNIETAAALFVSRKTVEAHLTRAYRKLGVRSRTELTRLLTTHDQAASPGDGSPPAHLVPPHLVPRQAQPWAHVLRHAQAREDPAAPDGADAAADRPG